MSQTLEEIRKEMSAEAEMDYWERLETFLAGEAEE